MLDRRAFSLMREYLWQHVYHIGLHISINRCRAETPIALKKRSLEMVKILNEMTLRCQFEFIRICVQFKRCFPIKSLLLKVKGMSIELSLTFRQKITHKINDVCM